MEDAIQQFRITVWPGPLPTPPVRSPASSYHLTESGVIVADVGLGPLMVYIDEEAGIEGDALAEVVGKGEVRVERMLSEQSPDELSSTGEIYLELCAVDLEDPNAVLSFVRRFGPLGVARGGFELFRSLPWFQSVARALSRSWPYGPRTEYLKSRGVSPYARNVETLSEFRFGARCLRDCVRAWQTISTGKDPGVIDWESIPVRALRAERDTRLTYGLELDALGEAFEFFLVQTLGSGLTPFHPAVIEAPSGTLRPAGPVLWQIPLYSVCCLELFNHIAEEAEHRICANEKCGRTFVRQAGRAEHHQFHRRGVKYCSTLCARAQAQRMHRGRARAKEPDAD
jgi:hypothetical protein